MGRNRKNSGEGTETLHDDKTKKIQGKEKQSYRGEDRQGTGRGT